MFSRSLSWPFVTLTSGIVLLITACGDGSLTDRATDRQGPPAAKAVPESAPQTAQIPSDPDIARAVALSRRILADPTPQREHVRRGDAAPAFDRAGYLADPASYLDHADGSRILVTAQPAADVDLVEAPYGTGFAVPPGGTAELTVRTDPGMPVTFTALSGGAFASGMETITVAADEQGLARTPFLAVPGATGACPVKAASPVRAGTIDFLIRVIPARAEATGSSGS